MQTQILPFNTITPARMCTLAQALDKGAVAVFATDTVYGLGTGALCEASVQRLYALKNRPATQPLQLLVADVQQAQQFAVLEDGVARVATQFWPGGLTLIVPPTASGHVLLRGSKGLGLRVPAHAGLQALLHHMHMPLASTSANVHGSPVLTRAQNVIAAFNGHVDFMLTDGDLSPVASSVLDVTVCPPRLLRSGSILKEDLARVYGAAIN